jgi:hypothetical protein
MQDPSEVATFTGFISPDNNDPTAHNTTVAWAEAGLDLRDRVHWNVFPWWVNITIKGRVVDPNRPPQTHAQARPLAIEMLSDLLAKLERLKVIVLLGQQAQTGFRGLHVENELRARGVDVLCCPSCSPQAWNNRDRSSGEKNSDLTIATLRRARAIIKDDQWNGSVDIGRCS